MKCILSGQSATILAKAIHSFARIGNELFIEADTGKGLSLRTINMTKSAFSMILFNLDFFNSFNAKSKTDDPYENQCKLSMKSCLGVFRNMKQVESCMMTLDTEHSKMIVQFKCRLETVKTHHIPILEHEALQASYVTDKAINILGGNHKLFSNIVSNFKANEEELSVKATEQQVIVQNYVDGSHVDNRFVRSHITLKPEEFENYKIAEEATITFCMRELRAILNFAESMNISVSANFEGPGKPVVFVMKNYDTFEANLVMSTLSPEDEEYEREKCHSQGETTSQNANIDLDRTNNDMHDKEQDTSNTSLASNSISLRKRTHADEINRTESMTIGRHSELDVMRKKRRTSIDTVNLPPMNSNGSVQTEVSMPIQPAKGDTESEEIQVVFQEDSHEMELPSFGTDPMNWDEMEELSSSRPRRDHRPFVRQVFQRCFTGNSDPSMDFGAVLAECSDEE